MSGRTSAQRGLRGTVYRRGAKWAFMIELSPDPLTGKRRQRAKSGFDTEGEAWEALAEANGELRTNTFVASSTRTVAEFFEEWLTTAAMTLKPTSLANYTAFAHAYVIPVIGTRRLQAIEPATLTAFYQHLLTSGRRKRDTDSEMFALWNASPEHARMGAAEIARRTGVSYSAASNAVRRYRNGKVPIPVDPGLSARTVASIHVMLRRAFADAVELRYLSTNPAARVRPPRIDRRGHATWTPQELGRFLDAARSDRFYALWVLLATTGMRRSEAVGAVRAAFDPVAGTLTVVSTRVVVSGRGRRSDGKSRRSRRLLGLDPTTVQVLIEHLAEQDVERAAFGASYQDEDLMFCWEDGRPLHPGAVSVRFQRIVRDAGLPRIRLHDVRHTYATMALRAGVNPKIVSTRLGHATVAFTLDTYTADIPELDQAAAVTISNLFLPPQEPRSTTMFTDPLTEQRPS